MSELRRKILDASVALVEEQGVRAVSFREVARRAGVSHQAPYHHFGNHRGILRAIAQEGFGELARAMQDAAVEAGPDPLNSLTASGTAYVQFAREHKGHFRVMFQKALVDIRDEDDPIEEAERTHGTLVRLAYAAHEAGYGAHLSADAVSHLCWSTVHGIAVLLVEDVLAAKAINGEEPDDDIEEALVVQVVGGLSALLRHDASPTDGERTS